MKQPAAAAAIDPLPRRRLGAALPTQRKTCFVTDTRLDVLCIGNAIVDVIAAADDDFLGREGLDKGSMRLIDAEEATRLYGHMGPGREVSGGSAGNTAAGIAMLGAKTGVIGQGADDELGDVYAPHINPGGGALAKPPRPPAGGPAAPRPGPG